MKHSRWADRLRAERRQPFSFEILELQQAMHDHIKASSEAFTRSVGIHLWGLEEVEPRENERSRGPSKWRKMGRRGVER